MNRSVKAILTGFSLLLGLYLTVLVIRVVWVVGLMMLPFLIIAFSVYVVGYGMPRFGKSGRKIHNTAEAKARQGLDWLDFNAPHWAWPAITATRTFLDWLGLKVAR
jgi:hypothetical protein